MLVTFQVLSSNLGLVAPLVNSTENIFIIPENLLDGASLEANIFHICEKNWLIYASYCGSALLTDVWGWMGQAARQVPSVSQCSLLWGYIG